MRASEAGQLIASKIGKRWPADRKEVYEILQLAINKAWKEGKWLNMTRELFVPKRYDRNNPFIVAPTSHPILLAINSDCQNGRMIRSKNFMFHRNGNGDVRNYPGCRWNQDVFDLGETPIIGEEKININSGVTIGVRAIGIPGPEEKVWINGTYSDDKKVYSYRKIEAGLTPCGCSVNKNDVETIHGLEIPIQQGVFNYICNVRFSSITAISKTVTRTPIEVVAMDWENNAQPIAELEPNQTRSSYRKYIIPVGCGDCVHGLFKIAQQRKIVSDTEELIIDDEEALIAICQGFDYIYNKKQLDLGAGLFASGIATLDKLKTETESPETFPIQVQMTMEGDVSPLEQIYQY